MRAGPAGAERQRPDRRRRHRRRSALLNEAYKTGGLKGAIDQVLGDSKDGQRRNREAWLEERGKQQDRRIEQFDADNKAFREKLEREGYAPADIEKTMQLRQREADRARRVRAGVEAAKRDPDLVGRKPLRFGTDPTAPMQGQPGAITPGVQSWQEAYPLDLSRRRAMPPIVPLPPQRPSSLPRGIDRVEDVLGPGPVAPQNVPLPPQRPIDLGGAAPKVDTSQIEAVKPKADEAKSAVEGLNVTVQPQVATGSISAARAEVQALKRELAEVGAMVGNVNSGMVRLKARSMKFDVSTSFSDGVTPGYGQP